MTRRVTLGLCTFATAALLSGCFTGQRPHFNNDPFGPGNRTGDEAIDALLSKLDAVTTGPATAFYSVLTKFGNTTVGASVMLDGARRSVQIDTTQYLATDGQQFTCTVDATTHISTDCTDGFDAARISNVGVTVDFYAAEAATRLRRDAQAQLSPAVAHEEVIANLDASCVSVALTGGTAVYCVLASGLIAKLDDGDVLITLGLFVPTVDNAKFLPPDA